MKVKSLCTTNTPTAKRGGKCGCIIRTGFEQMKLKEHGAIRAITKR